MITQRQAMPLGIRGRKNVKGRKGTAKKPKCKGLIICLYDGKV